MHDEVIERLGWDLLGLAELFYSRPDILQEELFLHEVSLEGLQEDLDDWRN